MTVLRGKPATTFLSLPHPSGIAVDRARARVYVASTRNPNQVYTLAPVVRVRGTRDDLPSDNRPLVPVASSFYPGSLYVHDLALVGGALHANAVGENTVVRLGSDGTYERAWWPRTIERTGKPDFSRNYLQLNSIAAGNDLASSFFSASSAVMTTRRPGHLGYPVDRRGVIFSGRTREPIVTGLTRPHSARQHDKELWLDNSGYGEFGVVIGRTFEPVIRLPGWTRGLCFVGDLAFVGTSRVIPRFYRYAPGLDAATCVCGVHVVDVTRGTLLGSITWPSGNQIFGLEWIRSETTGGLPFSRRAADRRARKLFYGFRTEATKGSSG
jgi:uncharacterized protein (TIGR03032 family)